MNEQRLTWKELADYLTVNHDKKGVVVFKQHPSWEKQYSEEERSYVVSGDNKFFYDNMISFSIFGTNLTKTDCAVRLDWYMFSPDEDRWEVDYCYLLEENK